MWRPRALSTSEARGGGGTGGASTRVDLEHLIGHAGRGCVGRAWRWIVVVVVDHAIEAFVVEAGRVERLATAAVGQRQLGGAAHVFDRRLRSPAYAAKRRGGLVHHQVGAQAVHLELGADAGDQIQQWVVDDHAREQRPSAIDARALGGLGTAPALGKGGRVGLVGDAASNDLGALGWIGHACDVDGEPEAVEQLRPQFAFLGVHRADQHELAG